MKQKIRSILDKSPAQLKQDRREAKKAKKALGPPTRDAMGHWLKGTSGNDMGRPRTALAELCRAEVTKHSLVKVLGSIAARTGDYDKKSKIPITVSDQINAIRLLLLYGFGVPKAEIDTGDVRIEVTYADNRQVNFTNAASSPGQDNRGGQALQRSVVRKALRQDDSGTEPADPACVDG
jgi:hypothetical protein